MFPIFDTERHYVKMLPLPYLNPPPPASTNHGLTLQETQARLSLGMHLSHESRHSAFANHNTAEWWVSLCTPHMSIIRPSHSACTDCTTSKFVSIANKMRAGAVWCVLFGELESPQALLAPLQPRAPPQVEKGLCVYVES